MGQTTVEEWEIKMRSALSDMLHSAQLGSPEADDEHMLNTPMRVVEMYKEMFAGCVKSPDEALDTIFHSTTKQMIHVKNITFYSMCAHHLLPFFGTVSFAYIPDGKIVGISKIPRLIETFARRPQVQEKLTDEIVNSFQSIVRPKGCALIMRAYHMCAMVRGVKQPSSYTETTALSGSFYEPHIKAEFLQSVSSDVPVWR